MYTEFLICIEAWALQWLECASLKIHLEPIIKELMLLYSDNIIITNCITGPKRQLYIAKQEALWANAAPYELIKNTGIHVHVHVYYSIYMYIITLQIFIASCTCTKMVEQPILILFIACTCTCTCTFTVHVYMDMYMYM